MNPYVLQAIGARLRISKKSAENQRESDDKMLKMATGVALGGLFSLGALRHLHDLMVRNAGENSRKRAIKWRELVTFLAFVL